MKKSAIAISFAAFCFCIPCLAQAASAESGAQTVENAQLFLSKVLVGTKSYLEGIPRPIVVTSARFKERCLLSIDAHGDPMGTWAAVDIVDGPFDFRTVTDIEKLGTTKVRVRMSDHMHDLKPWIWDAGSENLQARIAYAAEFLRQRCDETLSTGF